jgi:hypothetical protein
MRGQEAERGVQQVQDRVSGEKGAPHRRTERGTGHCVGIGGNRVKLREWVKSQVSFRKGVMATAKYCDV